MKKLAKVSAHHAKVLKYFPATELWRLGIEVTRQDEGTQAFYEEGYFDGIIKAFCYICTEPSRLSAQRLLEIFALCTGSLDSEAFVYDHRTFRDNFRAGYSIEPIERDAKRGYFTLQGFIGLVNKIKQHEKTSFGENRYELANIQHGCAPDYIDVDTCDPVQLYTGMLSGQYQLFFYSAKESPEALYARVDEYINNFYSALDDACTKDEKLYLIIQLVQDLEQLHPFPDANGRTISIIALNQLLMENNFNPVMLDNPNRISGFAVSLKKDDELRGEVASGMCNFQQYSIKSLWKHIKRLMFIEKKLEDELSQISDYVSNNPLIAMAQINAAHQLFEKSVHSWKIIVKGIFINKFTVNKQQFIIKKLELLYHENFMAVINDIEPYACSFDVLQSMLSDHYLFVNSDMPAVNFFKKNEVDMKKSMPIVSLCGR